jgi:hypothetical protein
MPGEQQKSIIHDRTKHASLSKDEETNAAAWEAARGAVTGGAKVRYLLITSYHFRSFSGCLFDCQGLFLRFVVATCVVCMREILCVFMTHFLFGQWVLRLRSVWFSTMEIEHGVESCVRGAHY